MHRYSVNSSMFKSIGYDSFWKVLQLEFHNGDIWNYKPFPKATYDLFMSYHSLGQYYNWYIKNNSLYKSEKVGNSNDANYVHYGSEPVNQPKADTTSFRNIFQNLSNTDVEFILNDLARRVLDQFMKREDLVKKVVDEMVRRMK